MAAAGSLPRNRVSILQRFNDTELLNCCWVNALLLQTSEALGDRARGGEPPPNAVNISY